MLSAKQNQAKQERQRAIAELRAAGKTVAQICKALKLGEMTVRRHFKVLDRQNPKNPAAPHAAQRPGRSLKDFQAQHDKNYIVPNRIRDGLKQLGAGWEYEAPFAKLCGISLQDLSVFRDQFSDHVVVLDRSGKRAWAGSADTAAKMREMVL